MDGVDAEVLDAVARWQGQGDDVLLATVARTWGSAPRPVGAMMALATRGRVAGSVSGGLHRRRSACQSGGRISSRGTPACADVRPDGR
ncbi:XdhC family protein [Pandoraea apista]|uniref:XdhC family protein n=1 Tax=Pandoraea apista TaxID=93218 RepID=UPI0021ADD2E3|nr:XdhC family protein [Pandoraea apista]